MSVLDVKIMKERNKSFNNFTSFLWVLLVYYFETGSGASVQSSPT